MSKHLPVTATGTWYLSSKTKPQATRAADGTFTLMLLCVDSQGPNKKEPYRVIWSGPAALAFWQTQAATLQPGVGLLMTLEKLRCFSAAGRHSGAEFHAHVKSLQVLTKDDKSAQDDTHFQPVALTT